MTKNDILLQMYMDGKLPNAILRQHRNKLLVTRKPDFTNYQATDKQLNNREKFRLAAIFAKSVEADPSLKNAYGVLTKKDQTVYTVAIKDYMQAPRIHGWDISGYHRRKGDSIFIRASDNVCVTRVMCRVINVFGFLLEENDAHYHPDIDRWEYKLHKNHNLSAAACFHFKAWDLAGNATIQKVGIRGSIARIKNST